MSNAAESPTALLARREMQSWRLLQLEPSALRRPDEFTAPPRLGIDGSHLAATLYRLGRERRIHDAERRAEFVDADQVYASVANRLSHLIEDVYAVSIDRDERRELLTLQVKARDGTIHPARALSDGTLCFLALAVLELDPEAQGLLCPEGVRIVPRGKLLAYLNPLAPAVTDNGRIAGTGAVMRVKRGRGRRVAERADLQMLLPLTADKG